MTGRPILFSGPMVRALLAGTKTQTRRVINPQPKLAPHHEPVRVEKRGERGWVWMVHTDRPSYQFATGDWRAPYAEGDRLYVREAWRTVPGVDDLTPRDLVPHLFPIHHEADGTSTNRLDKLSAMGGRVRQGMHMPRWASRLTLTVTDVRVQRLQKISWDDAIAEGAPLLAGSELVKSDDGGPVLTPKAWCRRLWDQLNDHRGFGWDVNPWVVDVSFTVERRNIDKVAA